MSAAMDAAYADQLNAAKRFIEQNDDFLVVAHVQPDGDAISSTAAVGWMLERLNKNYVMINEGSVPLKFRYMWGSERIADLGNDRPSRKFNRVISVDCADFARIGAVRELFEENVQLLNIDHHPTNDAFGSVNVLKTDAAATAEILTDLMDILDLPWDTDLATLIYSGLLTDTGGFRYSNTSPKVMNIASRLLQYGADGPKLAEHLLEKVSMAHIRLLQRALSRLSFSKDHQIGWLYVVSEDYAETGATKEETEGLVNYARNIEGVEVGILLRETGPDTVKVSLRSNSRANVAAIAQSFGGGGHIRAAGCTVRGSMKEAIEQIVKAVELAL